MSNRQSGQMFAKGVSKDVLEEGEVFAPAFDANGLIPTIACHAETGEVLMFAWMNAESLENTLKSGEAWYWSRSRGELWHKGATSGQIQKVTELRTDCDQDALVVKVLPQMPGACHVGYNSCFYRSVHINGDGITSLRFEETEKVAK